MFEIMAGLLSALAMTTPNDQPWAGAGQVRVLVRVDSDRAAQDKENAGVSRVDERPAEVRINVAELLQARSIEQQVIDPSSIEVIRHDAQTGAPLRSGKFAFGRHEFEIPSRWYDAAIPYEYPECEANLATSGGKLPRVLRERTGYFYECVGDGRDGRLAFVHRDDGQPAWYAVYFDLLPAGKLPDKQPPRGFVGDGLQRCEPKGHGTTGLIHSRLDLADLSGDGLPDMIVGCGRGSIVWYPNVGSAADWKFVNARLLATDDGVPIDIGYGSAPHALDFDADGMLDLLVGGERNRVVWFRNVGAATQPAWEYQGLVEVASRPLELPVTPVPEGPEVFKLDYYPVLASPDWDDDGDQDLLAGGYITGRIYYYENTAGRGAPLRLRFAGEIQADGAPLDVSWCAAPTVGDVDGDGDLDLFSGCMPMTAGGGDGVSRERFLLYFENVGTRAEPRLHARSLPREGEFPRGALATPRLADFNGDGLLDIVASSGERIFFFRNAGTRPLIWLIALYRWVTARAPASKARFVSA